jgi:adenine-specific DNA-methyltransferase
MISLNENYSQTDFRLFLKNFLPKDYEEKKSELDIEQSNEFFKKAILIGSVKSLNDLKIIEIERIKAEKSRVKITKELFKFFETHGYKNVLVITYSSKENHYRLSLILSDLVWVTDTKVKKVFSNPKRLSFLLGPEAKVHTANKQLIKLGKVKNFEDLHERFNVEIVNNEFFDNYKNLYLNLKDKLDTDKKFKEFSEKFNIKTSVFAKKLLGQIVFCYFLQKKGWLGVDNESKYGNGDLKFLRKSFLKCENKKKNYFNEFLENLFHDGLNNQSENDYINELECKIPYVGGGLFEPLEGYDWKKETLKVPNSLFSNKDSDGILDIFDLYNFTIDENDQFDIEMSIDPEMLGRVFENLLEENLRKGIGAFYTPRSIVNYMSVLSVARYLKKKVFTKININEIIVFLEIVSSSKNYLNFDLTKINPELENIIIDKSKLLDEILFKIRILDPAIGSGAFAINTMNVITSLRFLILQKYLKKNSNLYSLKKNFIQNSIFGVDIDQSAIDIAKLRLWLSLIVETQNIEEFDTLPNLDYKIMQGNTLVSKYLNYEFDDLNLTKDSQKRFDFVTEKKDQQLDLSLNYENLSENFLKLSNLQNEYFLAKYKSKKNRLNQEIRTQTQILLKDFLDSDKTLNDKEYFKDKINNLISNKEIRNFFSWKLFFPSVYLNNNGFDIIIGNPPYGEIIKENKEYFKNKYVSAQGKFESYKFFIERSLNFLSKDGILVLITPNTWMTLDYYKNLRNLIKSNFNIEDITKTLYDIFKSAKVDTVIFSISRKIHDNISSTILINNDFTFEKKIKNLFDGDKILLEEKDDVIKKLDTFDKLEKYFTIRQGLIAYASKKDKDKYTSKEKENKDYRKLLYGSDIKKYKVSWSGDWLAYGKHLHRPRESFIFDNNKILIQKIRNPKLKDRLVAALDNQKFINTDGLTNIMVKNNTNQKLLYLLLGIINSKVINYWYSFYFKNVNIQPSQISQIPILIDENKTSQKIVELVKSLIFEKSKNDTNQSKIKEISDDIDFQVNIFFGLKDLNK